MIMTLQACYEALSLGNYGIGAVLVVRNNGLELIFKGLNALYSDNLYRAHAEFNALEEQYQYSIISNNQKPEYLEQAQLEKRIIARSAPHNQDETIIFSSLEPCIMCTGGIINAKINQVVYAHEDNAAGIISEIHRLKLPPRWQELIKKQGLQTYLCTPDSSSEIAQASEELLYLLDIIYKISRPIMTKRLEEKGFSG